MVLPQPGLPPRFDLLPFVCLSRFPAEIVVSCKCGPTKYMFYCTIDSRKAARMFLKFRIKLMPLEAVLISLPLHLLQLVIPK